MKKLSLLLLLILLFTHSLTALAEDTLPTGVSDGFGTLTLDSSRSYEVAEVNMNERGDAMVIGEYSAFDADADMVGLYAVKEIFSDGTKSGYTLAYAYGDLTERQNILDMSPDGKHYATCRDTNNDADTTLFYPAMWSGSVSPSGGLGSDTIFAHQQINLTPYANARANFDALNEGDAGYAEAKTKLATAMVSAPTKTAGSPDGLKFNSTSLVLEDTVTIRHYFEKVDLDTYLSKYTSDIPYGEKGNYIYFDIENILAQDYNTQQTLAIKSKEGDTYEIKYSVANYLTSSASDSNTRLVSLVNAMYDYHLASKDYLKPKPLYLSYDATLSHESTQGGLHIYIPTKVGYIDHTFVRTVSESRNADMWRISRAYTVDDKLANPVQITVDNAEWDMALMVDGRDDFIGGWMHGDEIFDDIKFIIDGVETDVTTLTEKITFETMTIIESSTGYDPDNPSDEVLKHYKEFTISHAGIRLDQKVEWLNDYDIEYSYLAMMPPKKECTDSYYTNLDTVPKTIDYTNGQINESGATSVTVFGKDSGLYFTMTVNEYDTYIKPLMSIADNGGGPYHKMYFGFVNKGSVVKGDVWETFTQYKIDNKN